MPLSKTENLIVKYITKTSSSDELIELNNWLKKPNNKIKFKEYVRTHYAIIYSMNEIDAEKIKEQLLNKIRKDKSLFKRFKPLYKYAVAASVLLVVALTIFLSKKNSIQFTEPVIVNTAIEPGTDKATLTLEDGSIVPLEKGNTYQTQNANSNGEGIIYDARERNSSEIVYNYLTIPRGGQFFIKLSDGTKVWLNSESQIKYPVSFVDGKTRQVELVYGEAYFDVSPSAEHKGSKFKVFNRSQEVEVLGTEFNIKAYKDEVNIYTTLVEGKVSVDNGISKQNLVPNEQLNLNSENKNTTITVVDVMTEISWKNGVFSFRNKSLKNIMKVIARWYDVDVVFVNKDLESVKFKGNLNKTQSIERILSIMQSNALNEYEIKNKTILLK